VRRVHDAVAAAVPPHAPMADAIGAAVHAHLRAIHEAGDYTSANIRIFGQVPKTVRDGHQPVRRAYQRLWDDLLARGVAQGALRGDLHLPRLRNFVLGAMNASLEWVEPRRGTVAPIAAELTRLVLHGAAATAA
jgi:hypothetical protein